MNDERTPVSMEGPIPKHVAVIMDGNGRWAQKRNLPRTEGHKEGMEAVRRVAVRASERGVKVLTLFAFSTENWKRPLDEIRFLMKLPIDFFDVFMPELLKNNIRVTVTGFKGKIPGPTRKAVEKAVEQTKDNDGMILNFALNYGGRAEIVNATKEIAQLVKSGRLNVSDIDEATFEDHLLTASSVTPYQEVDLMIRSSGEQRLSNFLLWQNAYSEFYFSNLAWPEFNGDVFDEALSSFQQRSRRFGGL